MLSSEVPGWSVISDIVNVDSLSGGNPLNVISGFTIIMVFPLFLNEKKKRDLLFISSWLKLKSVHW